MKIKPTISFGTRIRKSPFFDSTIKFGAKEFTVYNKMYMPTFYRSYEEDYWSLINDVTLWDVGAQRQVEITGPDAEKFIEFITPRDISKCKIGQCMYALLVEEDGGITNDPIILKIAENHFWLSIADSDILLWCKGIASSGDYNININEPDVSPLALQGPKAQQVMEKIVGSWIKELKFFYFKEQMIENIPVIIARSGWSGEVGYEIYLRDGNLGNKLWEIIMDAGKDFNIAPATPSQISRIECGMLSYGTDMSLMENPFDIGLEKFVNLEKKAKCLSMDSLKLINKNGSKKELVGIEILCSSLTDFNSNLDLYLSDEKIGKITSGVHSPRLKKNIGIAIIKKRKESTKEDYKVNIDGRFDNVKICNLPFIRNK